MVCAICGDYSNGHFARGDSLTLHRELWSTYFSQMREGQNNYKEKYNKDKEEEEEEKDNTYFSEMREMREGAK